MRAQRPSDQHKKCQKQLAQAQGWQVLVRPCLGSSIAASSRRRTHFFPEERLDAIDAALVATAKRSIDLASYALTDLIVLDALNDAAGRRRR